MDGPTCKVPSLSSEEVSIQIQSETLCVSIFTMTEQDI